MISDSITCDAAERKEITAAAQMILAENLPANIILPDNVSARIFLADNFPAEAAHAGG